MNDSSEISYLVRISNCFNDTSKTCHSQGVSRFIANSKNKLKTDGYKQTGVPTLYANPSAWTKLGSVLMFDWPPPVGFS